MNDQLTLKAIALSWLNRLLNPSFEANFIWSAFGLGVSRIGYPRLLQLAASVRFIAESTYLELRLDPSSEKGVFWFGVLLVCSALWLFVRKTVQLC